MMQYRIIIDKNTGPSDIIFTLGYKSITYKLKGRYIIHGEHIEKLKQKALKILSKTE